MLFTAQTLNYHASASWLQGYEQPGCHTTGNSILLCAAQTLCLHSPAGLLQGSEQPGCLPQVTAHCSVLPKLLGCMHLLVGCRDVGSLVAMGHVSALASSYQPLYLEHPYQFLRFKMVTHTQNGTLQVYYTKYFLSVRTNNTAHEPFS